MKHQLRSTLAALLAGLGLVTGLAQGAVAQTGLPTFKQAPSARFTLTGHISVGPNTRQLGATGAQAGDTFEQDLTITPAGGGTPTTLNAVQIGMLYYFQLTGLNGWQVLDLSKTPGHVPTIQSNIPG